MRFLYLPVLIAATLLGQTKNPFAGKPEAIENGRKLFAEVCGACHGPNGEGGRGPSLTTGREVRRATDAQLFQSIRNGIRGTEMPPYPQAPEKIWLLVTFVRSLSAPAVEARLSGDHEAGRRIFETNCASCHSIAGQGGSLGPDLTEAGARLSLALLKEAIVAPNLRLADGYVPVQAVLQDGQTLTGVARNYNNYSLQLLEATGKLHLLDTRQLARVEFPGKSPMPADFAKRFTKVQMQDLIAFLSHQATRKIQ
ncbi:MAG: c-type cytochrome [Acidobacteriia bacterium]|nr:c-type cytochrome [Terriglobia bacterium]